MKDGLKILEAHMVCFKVLYCYSPGWCVEDCEKPQNSRSWPGFEL